MKMENTRNCKGLSAYQIKLIAVFFMTLDHLAAYGFEIPVFDQYYSELRMVGRIAAPLFFFTVTESIRYTRSKPRYLLRLYLVAVCVGLFTTVTNFLFGSFVGPFAQSNILFTFFYVTLFVMIIEGIVTGIKKRDRKQLLLCLLGIAGVCIIQAVWNFLFDLRLGDIFPNLTLKSIGLIRDIRDSLLAGPLDTQYTYWFVIMGVLMYFAKNKYAKTAVLVLFSGLCLYRDILPNYYEPNLPYAFAFAFDPSQFWMILAAPFMLLYNGEKGKGDKWFFYIYYPVHRYLISIIVYVYGLLAGV